MSYGEDDIKFLLTNFFETQKKLPDLHLKHLTKTTSWPEMVMEYWKSYGTDGANEKLQKSVNKIRPTAWQIQYMDKMDRWLSDAWQSYRPHKHKDTSHLTKEALAGLESEWKLRRDILFHLFLRGASLRDTAYALTYGGLRAIRYKKDRISHKTVDRIYKEFLSRLCKIANRERE